MRRPQQSLKTDPLISLGGRSIYHLLHPVLLAGLFFSPAPSPAAGPAIHEHKVKAAFLYNFAKFVEWPDEAFEGPRAPFVIGVSGGRSFAGALEQMIRGKTLRNRAVKITRCKTLNPPAPCHILFLSETAGRQRQARLEQLKGKPVLTVGNSPGFLAEGGIIAFAVAQNRIRFAVNREAAEKANLKISAKLLHLACRVEPDRPED